MEVILSLFYTRLHVPCSSFVRSSTIKIGGINMLLILRVVAIATRAFVLDVPRCTAAMVATELSEDYEAVSRLLAFLPSVKKDDDEMDLMTILAQRKQHQSRYAVHWSVLEFRCALCPLCVMWCYACLIHVCVCVCVCVWFVTAVVKPHRQHPPLHYRVLSFPHHRHPTATRVHPHPLPPWATCQILQWLVHN